MQPSTTVITVLHNSGAEVIDMVEALARDVQLVVVDNASSDDNLESIRRRRPDVNGVRLDRNVGFGAGCNIGAQHATGDVLIFLNPDCVPAPGALKRLSQEVGEDFRAVFGPELRNSDGSTRFNLRKASRPYHDILEALPSSAKWVPSEWRRDLPFNDRRYCHGGEVDYLQGACLALARQLFHELGGFDEDFFLYSEEEMLCRAVRSCGGRCVYLPDSAVTHHGATSTARVCAFACFQLSRSRAIFYRKIYGEVRGIAAVSSLVLTMLVMWPLRPLARRRHRGHAERSERNALRGLIAGSMYRLGRLRSPR